MYLEQLRMGTDEAGRSHMSVYLGVHPCATNSATLLEMRLSNTVCLELLLFIQTTPQS